MDGYEVVDSNVTREVLADWLRHPVTKVIGLLLLAEIARQLILKHGGALLGLAGDDAAREV